MSMQVFSLPESFDTPRAVLIFLHGVGASEQSMLPLAQAAPSDCRKLVLRAPITLPASGYAWFQVQFTSHGPVIQESEAQASLSLLKTSLAAWRKELPGVPVFLIGFSQGAIMSLLVNLTSPGLVDGAICLSGRFPAEFTSAIQQPDDENMPRLWVSHGVEDTVLPIHFAREIRSFLEKKHFRFAYREYAARHEVTPEMLQDAYAWLLDQLQEIAS